MAEPLYNPMPLGYLTVAASAVSVIANYPTYTDLTANKVDFQAAFGNGAQVYIGYVGMNTATGVALLKVLQPGESWSLTHNVGSNVLPVADLYIHGDNAGDLVLVFAHVV